MLQSLHVKNLALIEETEVEFERGLNILTGETGAGKSVLIGSVNLALGGKFDKDMIRKGADYCLVELVFASDDPKVSGKLDELDIPKEDDGCVIISRRMQPGRSTLKINGETVTSRQVKELAELLLDVHGQHEHQSLLHKKKHMEILDEYCGEDFREKLLELGALYKECRQLKAVIEEEAMDEEEKAREQALLEFVYSEIMEATLKPGEDEELELRYKRMVNSRKITESLSESYLLSGNDEEASAGYCISRALRCLGNVTMYDEELQKLEGQLMEIESLLSDYNHDLSRYLDDLEFDEEDFVAVEERLNVINNLKGKYGKSIEAVLAYGEDCAQKLEKLSDYEDYMASLEKKLTETEEKLRRSCEEVSAIRRKNAAELSERLKSALINLNFLSVEFEIDVRPEQNITALGYDDVEFLISTNPGESTKPLAQIASGGELSRVMLAIKTVLARKDAIDTLIFDEIDSGISGKTAWKVSGQLSEAAAVHQVICITHLPQIAAMSDVHFVIEKSRHEENTLTDIRKMNEDDSLKELARLLGSDELTNAALENAREMKRQAQERKCRREQ